MQQGFDLLQIEGFVQHSISAGVPGMRLSCRAHQDNGGDGMLRRGFLGVQGGNHLPPAQIGHHQISDNQGRLMLTRQFQGELAVLSNERPIAGIFDQISQRKGDWLLVLGNQH